MRTCFIVPAYRAQGTVEAVVRELRRTVPQAHIWVIDDGSGDDTGARAEAAGASVLKHETNRGKGAALLTGLAAAQDAGFETAVTVDADAQHPADQAQLLFESPAEARALVLGVRDLARDGAPRKNRISNGISNFFLSTFAGRSLRDSQCGLRRYPVRETLELGCRARGYAFESEVILRALAARIPLVEVPMRVHYPPESERVTHFDSVKDPARIVATVVQTLFDLHVTTPLSRRAPVVTK